MSNPNPRNPSDRGAETRGRERLLRDLEANPPATVHTVSELGAILDNMPLVSIGPDGLGGELQADELGRAIEQAFEPLRDLLRNCPRCFGRGIDPADEHARCACDLCQGAGTVDEPREAKLVQDLLLLRDQFKRDRDALNAITPTAGSSLYTRWLVDVAQALNRRDERWCPKCGEPCEFEPRRRAEPDTGLPAWNGGWRCGGCGHDRERQDHEYDDA